MDASNLVTRLRGWLDEDTPIGVIMNEAAARIVALEAALRPFAECARVFDPDMLGGTMPKTGPWQSWPRMVDNKLHMYELTVENLRNARAALEDKA